MLFSDMEKWIFNGEDGVLQSSIIKTAKGMIKRRFFLCHPTYLNSGIRIFISAVCRETANQLFGEKDFISTKLFDEVPLCASIASNNRIHASRKNSIAMNIKLPLVFWNITARLQWLLNIHVQKECRKETICRAEKIIKMIEEKGNDCILVTHGFFMHTLLKQMRKQGFKRSHTRLSYANGEFVIAVK